MAADKDNPIMHPPKRLSNHSKCETSNIDMNLEMVLDLQKKIKNLEEANSALMNELKQNKNQLNRTKSKCTSLLKTIDDLKKEK